MKYAVISDVHANYPALKSVIDSVENKVDGVIFLGDLIGLMGYPYETAELLMDLQPEHSLKGNHDIAVLEYGEGHVNSKELSDFELNITEDNLTEEQVEWITEKPTYKEIKKQGLVMSHAKPTPELSSGIEKGNAGLKKRDYIKASSQLADDFNFILVGHTHNQSKLDCSKFGHDIIVVNPGSVGQPIDKPAEYAIIDTDACTAELKTVDFDGDEVKEHLKSIDCPIKWWL